MHIYIHTYIWHVYLQCQNAVGTIVCQLLLDTQAGVSRAFQLFSSLEFYEFAWIKYTYWVNIDKGKERTIVKNNSSQSRHAPLK